MPGTTPTYGLPYPLSSDLVSAYPALGQDLAEDLDGILAAKTGYVRQATAPTGAYGLIWWDTSTSPAVAKQWTGSAWTPFSGARATVSGTTGSPTVDTTSRPGKTIYKFTNTAGGSITVGTAGLVEVLVVGGGGAGSYGGGGAGGVLTLTDAYLPAGTLTIAVGAGGAAAPAGSMPGLHGAASLVGSYIAPGGGCGGSYVSGQATAGHPGGSGGGGGANSAAGGAGTSGVGNAGGASFSNNTGAGGGGGAGAVGSAGASGVGGAGGAGVSSSITGSAVTYAGGGGGAGSSPGGGGSGGGGAGVYSGTSNNGTANTGGGGGGNYTTAIGGAGGSGYVVVVVG